MSPHEGQVIEGHGGFGLRLLTLTEELLAMEASYGAAGDLPPEHLHPRQDERFEVLEGSVRTIVDGQERVYRAGESFDVPAGTPHQMAGETAARVRWEVRPALRTAEFFERLYGGDVGPGFLEEYADEIRLVPPRG